MPATERGDIGLGATVTMTGHPGAFGQLLSIAVNNRTRNAIDVTHLLSTEMEFIPSRIRDAGSISLTILHPQIFNLDTLMSAAPAQVTITLPLLAGATTAAKMTVTGFVTSESSQIPLNDKMISTIEIKCTGAKVWTAAT